MVHSSHNVAAGVVIIEDGKVLLVKDEYGWCLPKGSSEIGEPLLHTAVREAKEETGYDVAAGNVAFITEYRTAQWGQYLQVYYEAAICGGTIGALDSEEISDIQFVPAAHARNLMKYRAWIIPLESWLQNRRTAYHYFDLDVEGFEI